MRLLSASLLVLVELSALCDILRFTALRWTLNFLPAPHLYFAALYVFYKYTGILLTIPILYRSTTAIVALGIWFSRSNGSYFLLPTRYFPPSTLLPYHESYFRWSVSAGAEATLWCAWISRQSRGLSFGVSTPMRRWDGCFGCMSVCMIIVKVDLYKCTYLYIIN